MKYSTLAECGPRLVLLERQVHRLKIMLALLLLLSAVFLFMGLTNNIEGGPSVKATTYEKPLMAVPSAGREPCAIQGTSV